ncbi:MAG: AraC family transcriptional regulator [Clostridia bacterium]|nr:AraC family transcriptional regulator [Clostridia bacterium]
MDLEAECLYRYVYGTEDIFNPHCHDFFEIFITISGTVTHWINGVTQRLPEGSLVFIRPDDVHGYIYSNPASTDTAYVNLTFTRETAELLFAYLSDSFPYRKLLDCDMPPTVTLNRIDKKHLLSEISELNIVKWQDKNALKLRMRAILADVFVRFFYDIPSEEDSTPPVWLTSLISDMEQPSNFVLGIKRMVELSGKSREHLARSLKKHYGLTAAQCISELRINYASNLLLHTNTPILDICFNCGFQSVSYFYKVFKDKYGISPKEFRRQYK